MRKKICLIYIISLIYIQINAGDIWIDARGTSSTSGTWNSGIRSDTETNIYPPYVVRWVKGAWRGEGINVVPPHNFAFIYNGYVYFGEGNGRDADLGISLEEPGWVWAWDIASGVTKTGYPLGPLDSGIVSVGGGIVIGENKLYALTTHKLWGWDISGPMPVTLTGFPVEITETVGLPAGYERWVRTENGLIYYRGKIYFVIGDHRGDTLDNRSYILVKDGNTGEEVWRRQISMHGGQTPAAWEGRIYVAERGGYSTKSKIRCYDAETGVDCANYPIEIEGWVMRTMPIIEGGKIYIGTQGGYFYRIDAITGDVDWYFLTPIHIPPPNREEIVSTASIWGDKVYFGVHNGKLYGLYKENGEIVPGFPVMGASDGPISTANGIVYTNTGVYTFCIKAGNGEVLWFSPVLSYMSGGVTTTYDYASVAIGENEIVSVYGKYNQIVVYSKPTATVTYTETPTMTNTPTETATRTGTATGSITQTWTITETRTATETNTPTITKTASGSITPSGTNTQTNTETLTPTWTASASPTGTATPGEFYLILHGNHPNPAEEGTYIVYEIGRAAEVVVKIYTISGEKIREIKGEGEEGWNSIYWDLKNKRGRRVSSGVYIYSIEASEERERKREKEWGKIGVIR